VLLDSLWWYVHKRPLDVLANALAGRSWGIIMHGLPDEASGLLGDMAEASFVVVPSYWAARQLESVRSSAATNGYLDVRVLYPGWDGRPGLVPGLPSSLRPEQTRPEDPGDRTVRIASSSNWIRAKGLVEAAHALGRLSRNPDCPPWLWQAAGTPDPALIAEAHSGLGPLASRLQTLGHLDPAAVVRLLHGADIFLHPSGQETFCLSVYEAALAGCRVVARAIGGVPEAIQLARLLRHQLGLPAVGVHLAPAGVQLAPAGVLPGPSGMTATTDPLVHALEAALAAVVNPGNGDSMLPAVQQTGFLHEFSWRGRLEKLLLGQSDRPLSVTLQPEQVEAS
jgi:glycosyltransferase involved in cell wall biosynthesis